MYRIAVYNWQLTALVVFVAFQLVAVAQGLVLFAIGDFFVFGGDTLYVTTNVLVMFGYKIIQEILAYRHHRRSMRSVRAHLVKQLTYLIPDHSRALNKLLKRYITIDRFLYEIGGMTDNLESLLSRAVRDIFGGQAPSVSVVAPIYGLSHPEVQMMMESLVNNVYPNIGNVYLVINDERDIDMKNFLQRLIARRFRNHPIKFHVIVEGKRGKRNAQYTGFEYCRNDGCKYIVNMDGDGFAHLYAVAASVTHMEANPRIGILTGDVRVSNWKSRLSEVGLIGWILTRVTGIRYHVAFWKERGAQSWTGDMNCGSGPWLVIRAEALWPVIDRWKNFKIFGVEANFGDDRHLTLEISDAGWRAEVLVDAVVWTDCPTSMRVYRKQQIRWNKSAWIYNALMYSRKLWHRYSPFVRFSVAYLTFYPFVVLFAIARVMHLGVANLIDSGLYAAVTAVWPYVASVLLVTFMFYSFSGLLLFRDWTYLLAPFYMPIWAWVQLPAKPWSLMTIKDQGWGTRQTAPQIDEVE